MVDGGLGRCVATLDCARQGRLVLRDPDVGECAGPSDRCGVRDTTKRRFLIFEVGDCAEIAVEIGRDGDEIELGLAPGTGKVGRVGHFVDVEPRPSGSATLPSSDDRGR